MNLPDRSPRVRVRKDRWMSLAAAGVLGLLAGAPAWALRPVQVYEVTVRGATAAILTLDTGIIVALKIYPRDPGELTVLQFLMFILSLAGLVLGALISERNAGEQRLSREEGCMRLLLESTGEAIYGVDLAGQCTFCNLAMLRLLRYASQNDVLGPNTRCHPSYPARRVALPCNRVRAV